MNKSLIIRELTLRYSPQEVERFAPVPPLKREAPGAADPAAGGAPPGTCHPGCDRRGVAAAFVETPGGEAAC